MNRQESADQQDGFVSIVVCIVIMVILSLVTIGFAKIMAREQRQALDRQLSTQAFYASESGVNDARADMVAGGSSYTQTCSPATDIVESSVRITCVMLNKEPASVKYDSVSTSPKAFPLQFKNNTGTIVAPDTITITWSRAVSVESNDFRASGSTGWPIRNNWQANLGLGKVYIIPFNNGDTQDSLLTRTGYMLLNPIDSIGANTLLSDISGINQGKVVNGNCNSSTQSCSVTVQMNVASNNLFMAISSEYQPSNFEITAKDAGGNDLKIIGLQAVIDSTGKTTDILRRIQVRVPLVDSFDYPNAAIAGDVCKLWITSPINSTNTCP